MLNSFGYLRYSLSMYCRHVRCVRMLCCGELGGPTAVPDSLDLELELEPALTELADVPVDVSLEGGR